MVIKRNFAKLFKSFFPQDFFKKDIKDKMSINRKVLFFSVVMSCLKNRTVKPNNNLICSTFQKSYFAQNSYSNVFHDFRQVVFQTENTIFVFHNIQKFINIQKFNSHHHKSL